MTVSKIVVAAAFAAGVLVSPGSFAQTSNQPTSTGNEEVAKDRTDASQTRNQQVSPTDSTMPSARQPMTDGSTGSTSAATPKSGKPVQGTDTSQ